MSIMNQSNIKISFVEKIGNHWHMTTHRGWEQNMKNMNNKRIQDRCWKPLCKMSKIN